jgi:uridylate kinase
MILDQTNNIPASLSEQAEGALYAIAEEMGIIVTQEEAAALEKMLEGAESTGTLTEMQNIVRLNRQSKLNAFVVRSALVIAQQKKDPLFAKYAKAAELRRKFRAMIVKKYSGQANVTARKLLANAGKRNMVDVSASKSFGHPESK